MTDELRARAGDIVHRESQFIMGTTPNGAPIITGKVEREWLEAPPSEAETERRVEKVATAAAELAQARQREIDQEAVERHLERDKELLDRAFTQGVLGGMRLALAQLPIVSAKDGATLMDVESYRALCSKMQPRQLDDGTFDLHLEIPPGGLAIDVGRG